MANICSIGCGIPDVPEIDIFRNQALDDYDIIFFDPSAILNHLDYSHPLRFSDSKETLSEEMSNIVDIYFSHWKNEINLALNAGKTVVVYSSLNHTINYAKRVNPKVNNWKTFETSIYDIFDLAQLNTDTLEGNTVISKNICIKNILEPLTASINYSVIFKELENAPDIIPVLETRGGRCVGLFGTRSKNNGKILIIPRISFQYSSLTILSDEEKQICKALIKMAVDLHNFKNNECEIPPEWVSDDIYKTETENRLNSRLVEIDTQIAELNQSKKPIEQEKETELTLKQLLFGKGKALENAVNMALNILGIQAAQYCFKNKDLEIDHLADMPDCILIGECEGKDTKDIDKTKISQLLTNKGEYYDEPDINTEKPIKLVLFGNPVRLTKPGDRQIDFTKACKDIARNNQVSLVKTVDLFNVATYIKDSNNTEFAKECAAAILQTEHGIVSFPAIPRK